jgi:hypothetical protein
MPGSAQDYKRDMSPHRLEFPTSSALPLLDSENRLNATRTAPFITFFQHCDPVLNQ